MGYGGIRSGEGFRRSVAAATALAGCLVLASCSSAAKPASCLSPRAVSQIYPGDPGAVPADPSTWHTGAEIDTPIPTAVQGMIVSFRGLNGDWDSRDDSKLISAERASAVAVKIGHEAVVFSTRFQAASGSPVCDAKPASIFSPAQPFDALVVKGDLLPSWG